MKQETAQRYYTMASDSDQSVYCAFGGVSWRSHSETCSGCIVSLTTVISSAFKPSRSVSLRSLAENPSRVFLASYFLR
jgi:hypothetical protein